MSELNVEPEPHAAAAWEVGAGAARAGCAIKCWRLPARWPW